MEFTDFALIVSLALLLFAGGWIRKLTKEVKDLVDCFTAAIEDDDITKEELAKIIKEAKDIKNLVLEIVKILNR